MYMAVAASTRATCDRKHVGAVIVRDKAILSTGYNGAVRGDLHCDEHGHMMEDGHCVRVNHAEWNAIILAARNGVRVDGADIYVTAMPCWQCFKAIVNVGIKRVVFGESYRPDSRVSELARRLCIELSPFGAPVVGYPCASPEQGSQTKGDSPMSTTDPTQAPPAADTPAAPPASSTPSLSDLATTVQADWSDATSKMAAYTAASTAAQQAHDALVAAHAKLDTDIQALVALAQQLDTDPGAGAPAATPAAAARR